MTTVMPTMLRAATVTSSGHDHRVSEVSDMPGNCTRYTFVVNSPSYPVHSLWLPSTLDAMATSTSPGRRERKKAATRKAIGDAALKLFLDRGFDAVSVREIADAADVSPTTVFAHFPCKEAIALDEDETRRDELVAVVTDRAADQSILDALHAYLRDNRREERMDADFLALLNSSPALNDYAQRMWLRHGDALATAIADELGTGAPDDTVLAFCRFVLQTQILAAEVSETPGDMSPALVDAAFDLLRPGWKEYLAHLS